MLWMRRSTYRRPIWSMTKTTTAMSAMTSRVSPVPERRASGSQEMESARNSMLTGYQVLSGMVDEAKVTKMIPGPGRRAWRSRFTPIIHGALNNGQGLHVCAPAARLCGIWQACRIRAFGRVGHTYHPFYRPKYQHRSPPRIREGIKGRGDRRPRLCRRQPVASSCPSRQSCQIDTMVRGVRSPHCVTWSMESIRPPPPEAEQRARKRLSSALAAGETQAGAALGRWRGGEAAARRPYPHIRLFPGRARPPARSNNRVRRRWPPWHRYLGGG